MICKICGTSLVEWKSGAPGFPSPYYSSLIDGSTYCDNAKREKGSGFKFHRKIIFKDYLKLMKPFK